MPRTVDELAAEADSIVVVKVTSSQARRADKAAERLPIYTDYRLQVTRVLKGDRPRALTLTQPHGRIGDLVQVTTDLPEFTPGEQAVLFLNASNEVYGGTQGKLTVEKGRIPSLDISVEEFAQQFRTGTLAPAVKPTQVPAPEPRPGTKAPRVARKSLDTMLSSAISSAIGTLATTTPLNSDFESGTSGWSIGTYTAGAPAWGRTSYRAAAGTWSLFGAGSGTGAVVPPAYVPEQVHTGAWTTTPIDLSSATLADLEYDVWTHLTASGSNWLAVEVATSTSGPWYFANNGYQMGTTAGWKHFTVDLRSVTDAFSGETKSFVGESAVYVRFRFYHTTGTTDYGAFIDNVKITAETGPAPTVTDVTPAGANAGIGETVTITGSGFGATAGSVHFQKGDSQNSGDYVTASIVSWSDTSITATVPQLAATWVRVNAADGKNSGAVPYATGFSTNGRRWTGLPVSYRINENTADMTGEGASIQAAFPTWNDAGSQFRLAYAGTTTKTGSTYDSENTISFVNDTANTYLGRNTYWYYLTTPPTLIESDIVFNDRYLWADGAASGVIDVETVALHELGHTVGLDDQYLEYAEVMSAYTGDAQRTLSPAEVAGAIHLYGADLTPPAAPVITSDSHPDPDTWVADNSASFSFETPDAAAYSYVLDQSAGTVPDTTAEGAQASATIDSVPDGESYFHVRAQGANGVWGDAAHYKLRVDTEAPTTTSDALTQYLRTATITLTPTDAHAQVAATYWRLDGIGEWHSGTTVTSDAPGEHTLEYYSVDYAGNTETPTVEAAFRIDLPTRVDQTGQGVTFSTGWASAEGASFWAKSWTYTYGAGRTATVVFEGTAIDWIATVAHTCGIATVSVDGGPAELVDLYYGGGTTYKRKVWGVSGLEDGRHVVTITSTGTKNPLSSNTIVNADAFDVVGVVGPDPVPTRYEQDAPGVEISDGWTYEAGPYLSGGTWIRTYDEGLTVQVTFEGTGVDWLTAVNHTGGIATVSVDGGEPETVDLYYGGGTTYKRKVWGVSGLTEGTHVVTITSTGTKNEVSANTVVSVDAFDVYGTMGPAPVLTRYEQTTPGITYTAGWGSASGSSFSGGSWTYTYGTGRTATVVFDGTAIDWIATVAHTCGIATVSIDGGPAETVDLYYGGGTTYKRKVWGVSGLQPGRHVVTIANTGTKNPLSSNTIVNVDAFDVTGALVP
ncbi:MAG: matrixin family metalloprotease [Bacteroidales bacterium]|nr:matrixin family metalloprotease [Bacteroidales bacterium]